MRVISGKYKGRQLQGFNQPGTRPTMDRVKESLFAILQNKLKGSIVLDLFAGSGSLGIEALSNGSKACYFVEINKKMLEILKNNLQTLKVEEEYYLLNRDYLDALKYFYQNNIKFDLIFLDPPYDLHLINKILEKIDEYNLLMEDGQVICEYLDEKIANDNFEVIKDKIYGSKRVTIFKQKRN